MFQFQTLLNNLLMVSSAHNRVPPSFKSCTFNLQQQRGKNICEIVLLSFDGAVAYKTHRTQQGRTCKCTLLSLHPCEPRGKRAISNTNVQETGLTQYKCKYSDERCQSCQKSVDSGNTSSPYLSCQKTNIFRRSSVAFGGLCTIANLRLIHTDCV
jgi:hypothetical protein